MRIFKIFLLVFLFVLSDSNSLLIKTWFVHPAYADSPKLDGDDNTPSDQASKPKCTLASYVLAAFGVLLATLLIVRSLPEPFGTPSFLTISATITAFVMANMIYFACAYAFVRHPVLRFKNGKYKSCTNTVEIKNNDETIALCKDNQHSEVNEYDWPKNRAPNGDYIEFCHREVLGGLNSAKMDLRERETSSAEQIKYKESVGGNLQCATLKAEQRIIIHGITYRAYNYGDKICVEAYGFGVLPWFQRPDIGCHLRAPYPPAPMCQASVAATDENGNIISYNNDKCFKCYVSAACYSAGGVYSHSPFVATTTIVQCLKETLKSLVNGCDGTSKVGFLDVAKKTLKNSILAVLVFAVALFGIKIIIGAVNEGKDIMFFLIKIAFVFYFGIGNGMNEYYDKIIAISNGLSTIVFQAGGNQTVCDYKSHEYNYPVRKPGASLSAKEFEIYKDIIKANSYHDYNGIAGAKDNIKSASGLTSIEYDTFVNKLRFEDFAYLLLWDQLDCRMGFYLGQSIFSSGVGIAAASIILWPLGLICAGQILFAIVIICLVMMLMLIMIWIIHIYILSLILITIVILFAPLFITMILFQATKGFFDAWLREIVAYSLYPVIIFGFLGLLFSVFDSIYFGDLTFKRESSNIGGSFRNVYNFVLEDDSACDKRYTNLACIVSKTSFIKTPLIFGIHATSPNVWADTGSAWKNFAVLMLVAFLFHHFLSILGALAGELAGSYRADLSKGAINPLEMAKKIASAASGSLDKIKQFANKSSGGTGDDSKGKGREGVKGGS